MIIGIGFIILVSGCSKTEAAIDCDVPEVIEGHHDYNKFVCIGVEQVQEQKYEKAIKSFEAALALHLFETPNFELFPQLAWAYFKAGDLKKAEDNLEKAELSLSVFTGILECGESEGGFYLHDQNGVRRTGKINDEVTAIMCGAAYDYIYERQSLERVLLEAGIVKRYFDVKQRIEEIASK